MCFHTYISEGPEVDFSQLAAGSKTSGAPQNRQLEGPEVGTSNCCFFVGMLFIYLYIYMYIRIYIYIDTIC